MDDRGGSADGFATEQGLCTAKGSDRTCAQVGAGDAATDRGAAPQRERAIWPRRSNRCGRRAGLSAPAKRRAGKRRRQSAAHLGNALLLRGLRVPRNPSLPSSEAEPGGQGRPDRAEASRTAGALDGRAERSYPGRRRLSGWRVHLRSSTETIIYLRALRSILVSGHHAFRMIRLRGASPPRAPLPSSSRSR